MPNLTEEQTYEAGIYQLETTDPVMAGPGGISNLQAKQLGNRTAYLKKHVDDIESGATSVGNSVNADKVDGFHASQAPGASQVVVTAADSSVNLLGPVTTVAAEGTGIRDMLILDTYGNGLPGRGTGILLKAASNNSGSVQVARIVGAQESTAAVADTASLIFQVADTTTRVLTERMRISKTGSLLVNTSTDNGAGKLQVDGNVVSVSDNSRSVGTGAVRWNTIYAGSGTINTSDARLKTAVTPMSVAEIAAAKELAAEIGTYQFLEAIAEKGADQARHHVGLTVQRAIEIMSGHGLDPFKYGFICYDEWDAYVVEHPAIEAEEAQPAQEGEPAVYETRLVPEEVILDSERTTIYRTAPVCIKEATAAVEAIEAVEAQPAWQETIREAGDRYSFRPDELLMFIARGFAATLADQEARLAAVEAALSAR